MSSSLSINRLVNTVVNLSPQATQMQSINNALILGQSNLANLNLPIIDYVEGYRTYSSLSALTDDGFSTTSPEYLSAALWFEQSPQPSSLLVGRWSQENEAGVLRCAPLSITQQAISNFTATSTTNYNGAFSIQFDADASPITLTGLDLGGVTSLNGVAMAIQTAIRISKAGVDVVWDASNSRFNIVSGTTGATSRVGYMLPPDNAQSVFKFSAGLPAANDYINLANTHVIFGSDVVIGDSLVNFATRLYNYLVNSTDTNISKFTYTLTTTGTPVTSFSITATAVATGYAGNGLATTASGTNISVTATIASSSSVTATSGGVGTDLSVLMGGRASTTSGAYTVPGRAGITAAAAVAAYDDAYGQLWYGLIMPTISAQADHEAVSAYIEAATTKHLYGISTSETGTPLSSSTTDTAYVMSQLAPTRTMGSYSSGNAYSVASLMSKALTVDYNGNSTVLDVMWKQEPGIVPEYLTASQLDAIGAKNCNVFVAYNNNTAIIQPGNLFSGDPIDIITGTDWLSLAIQTAIYNLQYTSYTKIPQTDAGNHIIYTVIESVCAQAVVNGLLAPGVWNSGGFGTLSQGDFMPKGYYIYAPPVATQLQADREARKSVTFQIAAKLAGAIRTVDIIINVNR